MITQISCPDKEGGVLMKEIRNLKGKKVCCLGKRKVEIVFHGIKTIIDFTNPDKPKIIHRSK